ncbi:hypothetical protein PENSPDRAFT_691094 [Peniophora sp. CONT]|nr:hypothetical protein PENSPDRAFT_691094 [Peniophora sp. CONT]
MKRVAFQSSLPRKVVVLEMEEAGPSNRGSSRRERGLRSPTPLSNLQSTSTYTQPRNGGAAPSTGQTQELTSLDDSSFISTTALEKTVSATRPSSYADFFAREEHPLVAAARARLGLGDVAAPAEFKPAPYRPLRWRPPVSAVSTESVPSLDNRVRPEDRVRRVRRAVPIDPPPIDGIPTTFRDPDSPPDLFPERYSEELRNRMIFEWQSEMEPRQWMRETCAVCAQEKFPADIKPFDPLDEHLDLLRDDSIPDELLPISYALDSYRHALLHPAGLINPLSRGMMQVCKTCVSSLKKKKMPRDALANKLYYAHDRLPRNVREAFDKSTVVDRMYASGCRMTRMTYLIDNPVKLDDKKRPMPRQGSSRGHCSFIPQDFGTMSSLIPAAPDDESLGLCVLFIGRGDVAPSRESVGQLLNPVMVCLPVVSVISKFLTSDNPVYKENGILYSEENLMAIARTLSGGRDTGVPASVQISVLDSGSAAVMHEAMQSGYSTVDLSQLVVPAGQMLIRNVGYANDSQSSVASTSAKALALDWVLHKKPFIQVKDGSRLFPDRHPAMLTLVFPHLDPYALGAFFHPERPLYLSMRRQLRDMVLMKDAPFAKDPNFAYVCFNAIQRNQTSVSATFRIQESQYAEFADTLIENRGVLEALENKYIRERPPR